MAFAGTNAVVSSLSERDTQLADLGAVYSVINIPGTAVAGHAAATTFDQTKALLYFINAGTSTIYPANLRLRLTNAGTAGTTIRFTTVLDKGTDRFTSGGTPFTATNNNMAFTNNSGIAALRFGAVVLGANTGSSRTVTDALLRPVIGVVQDTYSLVWGSATPGVIASVPTTGTNVADVVVGLPPVAVGPNCMFAIHQWSPSQSGAYQFEFEFDYFEK